MEKILNHIMIINFGMNSPIKDRVEQAKETVNVNFQQILQIIEVEYKKIEQLV